MSTNYEKDKTPRERARDAVLRSLPKDNQGWPLRDATDAEIEAELKRNPPAPGGFTVVEMLVVLTILLVIAFLIARAIKNWPSL